MQNASHMVDVLMACWFMMRDIEMANARSEDVDFQSNLVSILLPFQKMVGGASNAHVAHAFTSSALSTPWHATFPGRTGLGTTSPVYRELGHEEVN